jgi:hypothetical protein
MSNTTYALSVNNLFLGHSRWGMGDLSLHDYADDLADMGRSKKSRHLETDALVASGDYFVTLATALDQLSQTLAEHHQPEHMPLERLINDLMYLQRNYQISKKR